MDELTKRYAKALTAETEMAHVLTVAKARKTRHENVMIGITMANDPKAAQWKVVAQVAATPYSLRLDIDVLHAGHDHALAKARLAVIEDAIRLRGAEAYRDG